VFVPICPTIELVLLDESGSTGSITFHVPFGSTVTEAAASASALAAVALSVTDCVLVRQRIRYQYKSDDTSAAEPGSSIKRAGVFIFANADDATQTLVSVPGIRDEVLETEEPGTGVIIDTSLSSVSDFISALFDAGIVNPFDVAIASLVAAYRQSRV